MFAITKQGFKPSRNPSSYGLRCSEMMLRVAIKLALASELRDNGDMLSVTEVRVDMALMGLVIILYHFGFSRDLFLAHVGDTEKSREWKMNTP